MYQKLQHFLKNNCQLYKQISIPAESQYSKTWHSKCLTPVAQWPESIRHESEHYVGQHPPPPPPPHPSPTAWKIFCLRNISTLFQEHLSRRLILLLTHSWHFKYQLYKQNIFIWGHLVTHSWVKISVGEQYDRYHFWTEVGCEWITFCIVVYLTHMIIK